MISALCFCGLASAYFSANGSAINELFEGDFYKRTFHLKTNPPNSRVAKTFPRDKFEIVAKWFKWNSFGLRESQALNLFWLVYELDLSPETLIPEFVFYFSPFCT